MTWPTHPDGSNKTIGEMTTEERREQVAASRDRAAGARKSIHIDGPCAADKYKRHEMFLFGALSVLHPQRRIRQPNDPALALDFRDGCQIAAGGYINLSPDFDPVKFTSRLKLDHRLRRESRAGSLAARLSNQAKYGELPR